VERRVMNEYIISADIVSTVLMLVLLIATVLFADKKDSLSKTYIKMLIVQITGALADAVSYVFEGNDSTIHLALVLSLVSFFNGVFMILLYSKYIYLVIKERTNIVPFKLLPALIVGIVDIIIQIIGTINGKFIKIEDNRVVQGEWGAIAFLIPLLFLIHFYIVLIRFKKKLGNKSFWALSSYMFSPVVSIICELFFIHLDMTYPSISVSLLVIYVFIQTGRIDQFNLREQQLTEFSFIDPLTGLKNRRSYDNYLQEKSRGENIGVVFCDLNSLKNINDTLGHEAGDKYIMRFVSIFKEAFENGELFRISGDEFVCIIRGISEKEMEKLIADFKDKINKNERLAAVGYVYGKDLNVLNMVREAEKLMYKDKSDYYIITGIDRRK